MKNTGRFDGVERHPVVAAFLAQMVSSAKITGESCAFLKIGVDDSRFIGRFIRNGQHVFDKKNNIHLIFGVHVFRGEKAHAMGLKGRHFCMGIVPARRGPGMSTFDEDRYREYHPDHPANQNIRGRVERVRDGHDEFLERQEIEDERRRGERDDERFQE